MSAARAMRWLPALSVAFVAGLDAQTVDSTLCADRLGPSMAAIRESDEPIFTPPGAPGSSFYRRLLQLEVADTLGPGPLCALLRRYDLWLVSDRPRPRWVIVLSRRSPASLEELEHWRATFAAMPGLVTARLVPVARRLVRPLESGVGTVDGVSGRGVGSLAAADSAARARSRPGLW